MSEMNGGGFEQHEAAQSSWDTYVRALIDEHWEAMREAIGNAIGLAAEDLRGKIRKEMQEAIRVALLEAGWAPKIRGTWREVFKEVPTAEIADNRLSRVRTNPRGAQRYTFLTPVVAGVDADDLRLDRLRDRRVDHRAEAPG